jgi:predicted enzyme related to lactoylglutathione lyase
MIQPAENHLMTTPAKARLTHAAIFVSDLECGVKFCEKAFRLTLEARWMTGEALVEP